MKINNIQTSTSSTFKGKRLDKNAVEQLINNNSYSLNELNQRYISKAIENLSKVNGVKNIQFLLDAAAKNKYTTSIKLQDTPKNDWRGKLLAAASAAIAITPFAESKFAADLNALSKDNCSLNSNEQEILNQREQLLGVVDLFQINNETGGTIKNFKKNLDYFIISSETTLEHKKYVLERLNYFMSDKYEINPQLKDKKSIAVAEMINDMAISVPGNKVPNIKSINQKQHGMCAAISIVRKKLAYEDKPNYVDSIISELDATDKIRVYDRNHLGSGKKIDVYKVPVNFEAALAKGYRIIDASTTHWMQIGNMSGQNNIAYNIYTPFDQDNFDVKKDSFFNAPLADEELEKTQKYYQALIKAKSVIEDYKAAKIKRTVSKKAELQKREHNIKAAAKLGNFIKSELKNIDPKLTTGEIQKIYNGLLELEKSVSSKITEGDKFSYIPNEEDFMKKNKIKDYIINQTNTSEIKEESIEKLLFMINRYHSLTTSVKKPSMVRKANDLFDIAAAFRYQIIAGLNDKITLEDIMNAENIPNKEMLVLDTIDTLIKKLETNSPHSSLILEQLHQNAFESTDGSKEEILTSLYELKDLIVNGLTEHLDAIYASLTMGSRKEALESYLKNIINMIKDGNSSILKQFAESLGLKKSPNNVIKALEQDIERLKQGDEKVYSKLFDKYGNSSQIEYINNILQDFLKQCSEDNNEEIIMSFLEANGLSMEDDVNAFSARVDEIAKTIESIDNLIMLSAKSLRVVDKDGDILFSADPKDVIIKRLENDNRIVSAKKLRELQTHLDAIAKDRSSDEFQSRQGKLKNKQLTQFSNSEKQTLKDIDSSIDVMHTYVQKQMRNVRSDIRYYLEELARIAGVNSGHYWISEGGSGLYDEQYIRILEYITGRPHYSTKNIKKAIEEIKKSPYSGTSGSSVFHDREGGHVQYIADIEPVSITNKEGKKEIKEVLFHDNTWGASEKENIWIDSLGLTRTDYSDRRGGAEGYITNDKFRNGNLVDKILSSMVVSISPDTVESKMYKKLKHKDERKFSQYYNVVLDGKSPKLKSVSDKLYDALLVTNYDNTISRIKNIGKSYNEEKIQAIITNSKNVGISWESTYEILKKRIFNTFDKKIESKEDYDKLANDDYLKVVLEKMALKENFPLAALEQDLAQVRDIKDLSKFKAAQKNRAINGFKYAFSKTSSTIDYLTDSFSDSDYEKRDAILAKHNIKLSEEELDSIGQKFEIDMSEFDGSAKTTINLLLENLRKDINKVVSNVEVQQELEDFYRDYFTRTLYFNKKDLDLTEPDNQRISHIIEFIDRVFDPYDDEEFVEIYNQIQDMTIDEFQNEIMSKATYQDMGIKTTTGYDILKRLQLYEEKTNTNFMNTVFYDSLMQEIKKEKRKQSYIYDKFSRRVDYRFKQELDSIYRDLKSDLSYLEYPKLFNKYKERNFAQHGATPAYPKIEVLNKEYLEYSFNPTISIIEENVRSIKETQNQIRDYEIADLFKQLLAEAPKDLIISEENYVNINNLLKELILLNDNDPSLQITTSAAKSALEFEEGRPWNDYIPHIKSIIKQIDYFEKAAPQDSLKNIINNSLSQINAQKKAFSKGFIQTKYQNNIEEKLNKFEQALIKEDTQKAEILKNELFEDFQQYHFLNNPEDLLENYMKSCANDSELNRYNEIFSKILLRGLEYSKLFEIQEIIMDALNDGIALNAKSKFNKHYAHFTFGEYTMDTDEAISFIANSLILDDQLDTAILFLEKLGLNEQYVNYFCKNLDLIQMENLIYETYTIANNFAGFKKEFAAEFEKAANELENPDVDYNKVLDDFKNNILDIGAQHSINKKDLEGLFQGIEIVRENCKINLTQHKNILFATVMQSATNSLIENISQKIDTKNYVLSSNITLMNFINNIMLTEDSESYKLREEINEKFTKLVDVKTSLINLLENKNSDKIE